MKRYLFLLPFIVSSVFTLHAQQFYPLDQPVLPPSPSSGSVMKFAAVPPGLSSGITPVSIPLMTLPGRSLGALVGLSYHASGVKVAETPGPVGTSWGLISGGLISRTMYSRPDEMSEGYLKWKQLAGDDWSFSPDTIEMFAKGSWDSQADVFHFMFPGHSGKFVFGLDSNGNETIYTIPHSLMKIEWNDSDTIIGEFVITTEDGVKYYFGKDQSGSREAVESASSGSYYTGGASFEYNSAWYLLQVISPTIMDTVNYYYSACNEYVDYRYAEANYHPVWAYPVDGSTGSTEDYNALISYNVPILDSITAASGKITCYHSGNRLDLPAAQKIDSLALFNYLGDRIKSVQFDFTYFSCGTDSLSKRLVLSELTELGSDGSAMPEYTFTYSNGSSLPPRNSNKQDYWGYYNTNSEDFLYTAYLGEDGASRETHEDSVRSGLLTRIDLPAGGYKEFQYEVNKINKKRNYAITADIRITDQVSADWDSIAATTPDTIWFYLPAQDDVQIDYTLTCPAAPYKAFIRIKNSNNTEVWHSPNLNDEDPQATSYHRIVSQSLNAGNYYVYFDGFPDQSAEVEVQYRRYRDFAEPYTSYNAYVGGVRIKKVILNDGFSGANDIETNYTYYDTTSTTTSSGVLTDFLPNHHYQYRHERNDSTTLYFVRYARLNSLLFDDGYHIGYDAYQIKQGSGNGTTMVSVVSPSDEVNVSTETFPYSYPTSAGWKRGQVSGSFTYDSYDYLRSESYNTYAVYDEDGDANYKEVTGLKASLNSTQGTSSTDAIKHVSSWSHPVYQESTVYSVDGLSASGNEKRFWFENPDHMKMTRESVRISDQDSLVIRFSYPMDYPSGSNDSKSAALAFMRDTANMQGAPIEVYSYTGDSLLSAMCNTFKVLNSVVYPDTSFTYDIENPVPLSGFDTARIDASGNFVMDDAYRALNAIDEIDAFNRVQESHLIHGNPGVTLYGYNALYPVATFSNAGTAEVAYSSFECEQKGYFSYSDANVNPDTCAVTGDYILTSGTLSRSDIPSGNYFLTFWGKSPASIAVTNGSYALIDSSSANRQGMRFYQYSITATGSASLSLSSFTGIDEVRLFPKYSTVVTRTYIPLVGISSQAGANSIPSYTTYDAFGRPKQVKDQDKYILREYEYNFASQ